ncbi:hypothetical protein NUSPORA_02759 [Nucleospora cyclopteri]
MSSLKANPRIKIENNTIYYAPEFTIKTREDARELLERAKEGIEMERLCDGPINVRKIMLGKNEEVAPKLIGVRKRNKITLPPIIANNFIILRDLDGGEVAFYNEFTVEMDERVKELWNSITVPNYTDILEEMKMAGIKTNIQVAKRNTVIKTEKKRKKGRRRIKVTNTHVEGLDLNNLDEDY